MSERFESQIRTDFAAATGFLTILPFSWSMARTPDTPPDMTRAARAFPLVGACLGLAAGLVLVLADRLGLPPHGAALLSIAVTLALTGGLHEDGLADSFDGIAGGRTVERRLEIMRDSRIGTYGVLALVVSIGLRAALLAAYLPGHPWSGLFALIAAETISRAAMVHVWATEPAARPDGLASALGTPGGDTAALTRAVAAVMGAIAGTIAAGVFATLVALAAAALATTAIASWSRRRIGGRTGDVLGATQQAAAIAVLLALAAFR